MDDSLQVFRRNIVFQKIFSYNKITELREIRIWKWTEDSLKPLSVDAETAPKSEISNY